MIEKTLWHPVGKAVDLAGSPKAVVLLEEDVVIWQTPDGRFQAWADRCPHRGVQLVGNLKGNTGSGYHGGRVFIVGNPLGNIASGLAGAQRPGCVTGVN